jgi:hypothetical protein
MSTLKDLTIPDKGIRTVSAPSHMVPCADGSFFRHLRKRANQKSQKKREVEPQHLRTPISSTWHSSTRTTKTKLSTRPISCQIQACVDQSSGRRTIRSDLPVRSALQHWALQPRTKSSMTMLISASTRMPFPRRVNERRRKQGRCPSRKLN